MRRKAKMTSKATTPQPKEAKEPQSMAAKDEAAGGSPDVGYPTVWRSGQCEVRMSVVAPGMSAWLRVTSKKTGYLVFVPLPIRLIHQLPDSEGGGCIVRGAHGDEATATETIVEILDVLGGYPLQGASAWSIAK